MQPQYHCPPQCQRGVFLPAGAPQRQHHIQHQHRPQPPGHPHPNAVKFRLINNGVDHAPQAYTAKPALRGQQDCQQRPAYNDPPGIPPQRQAQHRANQQVARRDQQRPVQKQRQHRTQQSHPQQDIPNGFLPAGGCWLRNDRIHRYLLRGFGRFLRGLSLYQFIQCDMVQPGKRDQPF